MAILARISNQFLSKKPINEDNLDG